MIKIALMLALIGCSNHTSNPAEVAMAPQAARSTAIDETGVLSLATYACTTRLDCPNPRLYNCVAGHCVIQ